MPHANYFSFSLIYTWRLKELWAKLFQRKNITAEPKLIQNYLKTRVLLTHNNRGIQSFYITKYKLHCKRFSVYCLYQVHPIHFLFSPQVLRLVDILVCEKSDIKNNSMFQQPAEFGLTILYFHSFYIIMHENTSSIFKQYLGWIK